MTDIVAVEYKRMAATLVQLLFDGMRDRRFAGTGEPGEPDQRTLVSILIFPAFSCYGGTVPNGVG